MKINIITEAAPGWVLRNICENLIKYLPDSYITDLNPDGKADINLYINYGYFTKKSNKIDIGWFTHREGELFDNIAKQVDYCISMCDKTAKLLPAEKTVVIKPCADPQFSKEVIFGCIGKHQESGRKRFHLIEDLRKAGFKILFTNQQVAWKDMPAFYKQIDYLLILSDNEGGPMPVLEAIACGKPIIAPDVGWCWDYPIIRYTSFDELKSILNLLRTPADCWKMSALKTYEFCRKVYELKR